MLELSPTAAATLANLRSQSGLPDNFGVRVFRSTTPDSPSAVELDLVAGPQEGDQIGKTEAIEFYVAPEVAQPLDDAVLDALDTPEGIELMLKRRT